MSDYCTKEAEISMLITKIKAMEKDIEGNGKPGLRDTVTEMNVTHNLMAKDLGGIKTSMSAFAQFMTEYNAVKNNNNKKLVIAMTIMTLIFTGISLLT